jgi:hypothetical protein
MQSDSTRSVDRRKFLRLATAGAITTGMGLPLSVVGADRTNPW